MFTGVKARWERRFLLRALLVLRFGFAMTIPTIVNGRPAEHRGRGSHSKRPYERASRRNKAKDTMLLAEACQRPKRPISARQVSPSALVGGHLGRSAHMSAVRTALQSPQAARGRQEFVRGQLPGNSR